MLLGFLAGLVTGIASTPHCLGMCGGLPLHFARGAKGWQAAVRPLLFVAGKSLTYAFLGALAGFSGHVIVHGSAFPEMRQVLGYAVGIGMALVGLGMLGLRLPRPLSAVPESKWGWLSGMYQGFFASPGTASSLYGGAAAGFLPCPITIVALAPALAAHDVLVGMAIMVGLGIGTAPVLFASGVFGSVLHGKLRGMGLRWAGAVVLAVGMTLVVRASGLLCGGAAPCRHGAPPATGRPSGAPSEGAHARPGM